MSSPGTAGVARFDGFEFDLSSGELRKSQTRLRVPDQSLAIQHLAAGAREAGYLLMESEREDPSG